MNNMYAIVEIGSNNTKTHIYKNEELMKVITNLISHKIDAKYIIPTKINMEDGLKMKKM